MTDQLRRAHAAHDAKEPDDPAECETYGCDWKPIGKGWYRCRKCGVENEV